MYSFNVVLGLLDELLELKEHVKHESEASQALDLISLQISLNFKFLIYCYDSQIAGSC